MKFYSLILIVLVTFSCMQKKDNSMKHAQINNALVQQYFEHFNNHDWNKMAAMYTEVADFKDPSLGSGIIKQTQAQIIQKYSELHSVFADIHDTVIKTYPSGEKHIVVEFVSSGTAPDGSKFELPICTIFTIEKGKITKDFSYFDNFEE